MDFLFDNFWIMFIAGTIVNGLIFFYNSKKKIKVDPSLKDGYEKLFKGWMFFGNIPWVIIGIGNLTGMTESSFEFFFPREMNPIVLIFHAVVVCLWILSAWWIYFQDGAEYLEKHPGLINGLGFGSSDTAPAKYIKIIFPITILGGIFGMVLMWTTF